MSAVGHWVRSKLGSKGNGAKREEVPTLVDSMEQTRYQSWENRPRGEAKKKCSKGDEVE